jgi:hypothetical protein
MKQRPGWRRRLARDGSATWTDPTGRVRTTAPLDALTPLVLTADAIPEPPGIASDADLTATAAWSALETHLGCTLEHRSHDDLEQRQWLPVTHRRCTSSVDLRTGIERRRTKVFPDTPPF